MKNIAALYIDNPYNVYHSISVLVELAKHDDFKVHILCTKRNYTLINDLLGNLECHTIKIQILYPFWRITLPVYVEIKLGLRDILARKYKKTLGSFDLLICSMYNDAKLKSILKDYPPALLLYTCHGVGNRTYSYSDEITKFDLFFLSGDKDRRKRKELHQLNSTNHILTGYPKLDVINKDQSKRFFSNDNPIIIYNPHWEKNLTSYFKFGKKILEFFSKNEKYNLIFAPHSLLIDRNLWLLLGLLKYRKFKNILIDTGSQYSNDMTYLKNADLYLGDASSQALEFLLINERPCLFLNAIDVSEIGPKTFISWDLGDVISSMNSFENKLDNSFSNHTSKYLERQKALVNDLFHQENKTASIIAAQGIIKFLEN